MAQEVISGVPVDYGPYEGPIMDVYFFNDDNSPYTAFYTNFSGHFFGEGDVREFIQKKLNEHNDTKRVLVTYHNCD